jgi:hypothetical protein
MRRTRTADQSSLFSFGFTSIAKKEDRREYWRFWWACVEPSATVMPISPPPVSVSHVKQSSNSQQSIQSVNSHDCSHPDDIGAAVSWPGDSTKEPADLKLLKSNLRFRMGEERLSSLQGRPSPLSLWSRSHPLMVSASEREKFFGITDTRRWVLAHSGHENPTAEEPVF